MKSFYSPDNYNTSDNKEGKPIKYIEN